LCKAALRLILIDFSLREIRIQDAVYRLLQMSFDVKDDYGGKQFAAELTPD